MILIKAKDRLLKISKHKAFNDDHSLYADENQLGSIVQGIFGLLEDDTHKSYKAYTVPFLA